MISVIIPAYNVGVKLNQIIEDMRKQTLPEWELILVDDGSVDDTGEIADRACQKEQRIHCIHQKNQGVSAARNRGLQEAKGEYIAFLDGDDRIRENYLETLYRYCQNADISVCDVAIVQNETEVNRFTMENSRLSGEEAINLLLERRCINSGPCAKLFKTEIIKELRFLPMKTYEDILFVLEAFDQANKIAVTNETEYVYIQNEHGAMHQVIQDPSLDIVKATEQLLNYIKGHAFTTDYSMYITVSHLLQYAAELLKQRQYHTNQFIDETRKLYKKHMKEILQCKAIPYKEKTVFFLFSRGFMLEHKSIKKMHK